MVIFLTVLILFLLAFTGLAIGLLLKRKGLRGSCSPGPDAGHDCQCHPRKGAARRVDQ
jgi:hypothetical protein